MIAVIMERMLAVQAMVMVVIPGRISGENTNHVLNILYKAYPLSMHTKNNPITEYVQCYKTLTTF